jgi:hypothetical protein
VFKRSCVWKMIVDDLDLVDFVKHHWFFYNLFFLLYIYLPSSLSFELNSDMVPTNEIDCKSMIVWKNTHLFCRLFYFYWLVISGLIIAYELFLYCSKLYQWILFHFLALKSDWFYEYQSSFNKKWLWSFNSLFHAIFSILHCNLFIHNWSYYSFSCLFFGSYHNALNSIQTSYFLLINWGTKWFGLFLRNT